MRLILGSASPRRLELLAQLGLVPDEVRVPDIDETPRPDEPARSYVLRMAREKAAALDVAEGEVLVAADTTVTTGRRILGKPADAAEALAFLGLLSGRRHRVITAVAVRTATGLRSREVLSRVRVKRLSEAEKQGYVASGEWRGKAGGYAIQGPFAAFVPHVEGSHSAIVGLPLHETAMMLAAAGLPIRGMAS
jgi:septum formation protein